MGKITLFCILLVCNCIHGQDSSFNLAADTQGTLVFTGDSLADLFSRELDESYKGVLTYNYVSTMNGAAPLGFTHASPPGQLWSNTWWTRDGGTFTRELVLWGNYERACVSVDALIKLVAKNADGFYEYPEYFSFTRTPATGTEMDGTASIIIGMALLWQRLPDNPFKRKIYDFLHGSSSPAMGVCFQVDQYGLVRGSGEFGQGCCGPYRPVHNVVQNNLCWMSLEAMAEVESAAGDTASARFYQEHASTLRANILEYFINSSDSSWNWTLDTGSFTPTAFSAIVDGQNFAGLNGAISMFSDAMGLEPLLYPWDGIRCGLKTWDRLWNYSSRRSDFNAYGLYILGNLRQSAPSYDEGYALQSMLLCDMDTLADKAVRSLAYYTYDQGQPYSPYHFYESMSVPPGANMASRGCGALNLVNVSEPLKAARLMLGLDDRFPDSTLLVPRCPVSWTSCEAENWPVLTPEGMVRADLRYQRFGDTASAVFVTVLRNAFLPRLTVRLDSCGTHVWRTESDVTETVFESHAGMLSDSRPSVRHGREIRLEAYPNPFNPSVNVQYKLPANTDAEYRIFNMEGKLLFQTTLAAGKTEGTLTWNTYGLPSGCYFGRLETKTGRKLTQTLMLMK